MEGAGKARMRVMMSLNLRRIFFLGALALSGVSAVRAQVGVYGMVSAERIGGFTCATVTGCASSDGKERPYGGTLGAFYDFRSYGPIRVGADLRATFLNGNKSAELFSASSDLVRHYSGLGGLRATFRTPFKVLNPYAQISGGYGKLRGSYGTQASAQVQGFAGLDLALFTNVDLRVIEVGAGEIFGNNSHSIQTIGLGLVFHGSRDK